MGNGRLVGIDWRYVGLKGELSTEKFSALRYLNCGSECKDSQLTSLDVTKNTALTSLYCEHNQLTSLDVTKNTELLDNNISCDENVTIIRNNN